MPDALAELGTHRSGGTGWHLLGVADTSLMHWVYCAGQVTPAAPGCLSVKHIRQTVGVLSRKAWAETRESQFVILNGPNKYCREGNAFNWKHN